MKNTSKILSSLALVILVLWTACTPMDEYLDYVPNGEIVYPGKVDSIKAYSGKNRVKIEGLLTTDPNVTKLIVFWNTSRDSVIVPVVKTENVDTVSVMIENLAENTWSFIIRTEDNEGNRSVPVYTFGTSYGERYQLGLINQIMYQPVYSEGILTAEWGEVDFLEGLIGSEVVYENVDGTQSKIWRSVASKEKLIIDDYKDGTSLEYRSYYRPDSTAIDTFVTNYNKVAVMTDITNTYLKNPSTPYEHGEVMVDPWGNPSSRYATPTHWITNQDVRNVLAFDGNHYGGWDNLTLGWDGRGVLSFESGWDNLPAIPNGKIYQTMKLPAGDYEFEFNIRDSGHNGSLETLKYCAVSAGSVLLDVDKVSTEAIAYLTLNNDRGVKSISFSLEEETEVSIGWVCKFSTDQTWLKIESTSLKGAIVRE